MSKVKHCAQYNKDILGKFREIIKPGIVLDPFGGVGNIGLLGDNYFTISLEIEPKWAKCGLLKCYYVIVGDALNLPFGNGVIPTIATSITYGNRMADQYVPKTEKRSDQCRQTYRLSLGEELHNNNSGRFQWPSNKYKDFHVQFAKEAYRVLETGGELILNCKNHVRKNKEQFVCEWHTKNLINNGFTLTRELQVRGDGHKVTQMMRKNGKLTITIDHEMIYVFTKVG